MSSNLLKEMSVEELKAESKKQSEHPKRVELIKQEIEKRKKK